MNAPLAATARKTRLADFFRRGWRPGVLPGFTPTLGITLIYLSAIVLIPLAAMVLRSAGIGWSEFWATVSSPRALAAYKLSFGGALVAGAVNTVAGLLLAWILVRYQFLGKSVVDALIDLPLALPTAVRAESLYNTGFEAVARPSTEIENRKGGRT